MQQSGQEGDAYQGGNRGIDQNLLNPHNILATDFASGGSPSISSLQANLDSLRRRAVIAIVVAAFFAATSARLALFAAVVLFAPAISAAFLSWTRRAAA